MSGDLLQTKLYVPRKRPFLVPRPHLIKKLSQGLHRKLTLISAPAGFGKTTLVSEWIASEERPFAWLSLDERDSDLTRFLQYLIATLQTGNSVIGTKALAMLTSGQPPTESILTSLLNEITAVPQEFALVLDDYHVVDAPSIDQALIFLLDHLPPQMHLVITTREDPTLPLSRLRARGQLTELRASDLRFTIEETAVFLQTVMGISLSSNQIAALETRTEGWVAGLQMAALSMQDRDDVAEFIANFTGSNRFIMDYLLEEVLNQQPVEIQKFLLQTAVLTRLCAGLLEHDFEKVSLHQVLEEECRLSLARVKSSFEARLADETEAKLLNLPLPAAVLVMRQTNYLANGRPIEYCRSVYRANERFYLG